ncbi:hypothetical protein NFJ02_10g03940 [Pycnococcus provasolii]
MTCSYRRGISAQRIGAGPLEPTLQGVHLQPDFEVAAPLEGTRFTFANLGKDVCFEVASRHTQPCAAQKVRVKSCRRRLSRFLGLTYNTICVNKKNSPVFSKVRFVFRLMTWRLNLRIPRHPISGRSYSKPGSI